MKLRRFIAALLALVLLISNSPLNLIEFVWATDTTQTIAANNADLMLWSKYVKDTGSQLERDGTDGRAHMIDDHAYVDSLLTDAAGEFNKSGEEWVWFAYKVTAGQAGEYTLGLNVTNISNQRGTTGHLIPICVDGKVYTVTCNGKGQSLTTTVNLTAGSHVVVMFMPMPKNASDAIDATNANSNAWKDYTWICVNKIIVDSALTVSKPTVAEVEACFGRRINALDETVVLNNKRKTSETGKLSFGDYNGIRGDLATVDKLPFSGNLIGDWPFASVKVTAIQDGEYTVTLNLEPNTGAAAEYVGILVDGTAYAVKYAKNASTNATVTVPLTKGDHVITFFTPMPKDHSSSYAGDWSYYPWVNFTTIELSAGITAVSKPTVEEIKAPLDNTVFAIDSSSVTWSNALEADPSGGNYLKRKDSGTKIYADKPLIASLYSDAFGEFNASGEEWTWFAYKVNAPQAGKYTLGVTTQGCRSSSFKIPLCVNDTVYTLSYNAAKQMQTTEVDLAAGENVIVMFMPIPADETEIAAMAENEEYKYYVWCNVESVLVDGALEVKAAPTAAEVENCFQKTVQPESDSVLANKFDTKAENIGDGKLTDADAGQIREDQPTIDLLPYAGNLIGGWPYMSVKVTAPEDGTYPIRVNANMKKADDAPGQLAMVVDGEVHILEFAKPASNDATVKIDAQLTLTEGAHVITFLTPMPAQVSEKIQNVYNQYPWTNFNVILLSKELAASKPTAEEVKANLGTTISAADRSSVVVNKYVNKETKLGDADRQWLKDNRVSLETLLQKGMTNAPYAGFFVNASADGTYDICAVVATKADLTAEQVALIVDGKQVYAVSVAKQDGNQLIRAQVALTAGEHSIAFTSPMPMTDTQAQAITAGEDDNWVAMNANYPWMDYIRFAIDKDLSLVYGAADPTLEGVEAEDKDFVQYHGNHEVHLQVGASGGLVAGGTESVISADKIAVSGAPYIDWGKLPYGEFAVAGGKGAYQIKLDVIAKCAAGNEGDAIPKVYVYVNGKVYEKTLTAWDTLETITVTVELADGINVFKILAAAEKVKEGNYILFDAFYYDSAYLTAVSVDDAQAAKTEYNFTVTVEEESKVAEEVLTNRYEAFGDQLQTVDGGLGDARWSKYYIDGLNANQLPRIPYAAVKVNADKDGYYDICLVAGPNTGADSQQIAIMIDGKVYPMTFVSAGITTLRATVYLEEGEHLLIFTSPMPLGKATADTSNSENEKSLYPWFNMKKLVLDPGLSIGEIPTALEMEYADVFNTVGTIINAGDESHVIANLFKDNGDTQGNANLNPARENRISLETLLEKGVKNVPGVSFRVTAGEDGSYGIYATISANKALTSYQLALVLDGQKVIPVTVTNIDGNQVICASVELTKGTHTVALTTPMPATEEEAPSVPTNDDWSDMSAAYPWTDFIRIAVDKNLAIEKVATEAPEGSTELEDEDFFQHHGNYGTEASHGTSGGSVVTGNDTIASADQITDNGAPSYNWSELSYVEFGVDAKGTGKQDITFGVDATAAEEAGLKLMLFVNGQWQEAAVKKDGAGEVTVTVELEAGTNVVRCVVVAQKAAANANIVFDYVKFDTDALKLVKVKDMAQIVVNAGDETKVLFGHYTDKGETLGDSSVGDLRWDSLALEQITCDNLERMPYFALKVNAEADGYYDILLDIGTNNKTVSDQLGLLVDGKDLQVLSFKLAASTQIKATVYLKAGTHTLTFTTPMPQTVTELQTYLDNNDLERGNGITHPWMDAKTVTLGKGLKVEAKPHVSEVEYPFYTRMEAENGEYVVYNNYNTPNESSSIASGEKVVGGAWNSIYEQTFEELEAWLDAKHNAYVEYAVYAPADGEYDIRVGFLAGTNDKTVAKPYIAVIANGTTHKVQFTKNWGNIDRVKLTVKLKEGLNIIRCTSMTTEQGLYSVKGWINHDCLDLDTRLTPVKHSTLTVEAEDSKYVNKFKVQDGADYEAASGKVLGSADRKYVTGLKLTLDQLTEAQLKQIPYFSITVNAPENGYYPVSVNMSGDGRLPRGTIGVLVDGDMNVAYYSRTGKATADARVDALVYLTKGDHVITFTMPIPADAAVEANYSYYWCNFDSVMLHNGLELATEQKAPTAQPDYERVEVEDHAMFNQSHNNTTASGNAYYRSSQTVAEMLENGIDSAKTPFAEIMVHAAKAGTYTIYLGVNSGMTQGCSADETDAKFVVAVNGKMQAKTVHTSKTGISAVIAVELELVQGANVIRLTHLGKDSQCGGTTWIDFDYIEMSADVSAQLRFAKTGEKLEAENQSYSGYSENVNDSYSGGKYLGDPNYDDVDEGDITFEKLDPADVGEMPHVTYRVYAAEAGTYSLTVGFAAGMYNYPAAEITAGDIGGFAVIVNGQIKQLVEFEIASTNTKMSRLITVELQEGENEITITTTLAEYIIDRMPKVDETYRLIWVDHDYLLLSESLSAMSSEGGDYDVGDSDHDHAQIETKPSAGDQGNTQPTVPGDTTISDPAGTPDVLVIIWVLVSVCVVAALIILLVYRKRKKNSK